METQANSLSRASLPLARQARRLREVRASSLSGPSLPLRAILWLFALLTVFPFTLLLLTSLKSQPDLLRGAFTLPDRPHFENFLSAWIDGHFGTHFLNSILVVVPSVVSLMIENVFSRAIVSTFLADIHEASPARTRRIPDAPASNPARTSAGRASPDRGRAPRRSS